MCESVSVLLVHGSSTLHQSEVRTPSTGVVTWMACDRVEGRRGGRRRSAADENRTLGSSTGLGCSFWELGLAGDGDVLGRHRAGLAADASDGRPDITAPATPPARREIPGREFIPFAPETTSKQTHYWSRRCWVTFSEWTQQ